jgi:hypothetical protein
MAETRQTAAALENIHALKDTYSELFHLVHDNETATYDEAFFGRFKELLDSTLPTPVTDVDPNVYRAVMAEVLYFIFSRDVAASQEFFRKSRQRFLSMFTNGYSTGLMLGVSNNVYIKAPRFVLGTDEKFEVREKDQKTETQRPATHRPQSGRPQTARTGARTETRQTTGRGGARGTGVVRRVITEEYVVDKKPVKRTTKTNAAQRSTGGAEATLESWADDSEC